MAAHYSLSRRAEADLYKIHADGVRQFGHRRADQYLVELLAVFDLLAERPEMARLRTELKRPVRVHAHRSHVVAYAETSDGILVVRVLHAHCDWEERL